MPREDTRVTTPCLSPYHFSISFSLRFYLRYVEEERWRADFSHGKSEKDALLRREQLFSLEPNSFFFIVTSLSISLFLLLSFLHACSHNDRTTPFSFFLFSLSLDSSRTNRSRTEIRSWRRG